MTAEPFPTAYGKIHHLRSRQSLQLKLFGYNVAAPGLRTPTEARCHFPVPAPVRASFVPVTALDLEFTIKDSPVDLEFIIKDSPADLDLEFTIKDSPADLDLGLEFIIKDSPVDLDLEFTIKDSSLDCHTLVPVSALDT
jgi:hypothetical protein